MGNIRSKINCFLRAIIIVTVLSLTMLVCAASADMDTSESRMKAYNDFKSSGASGEADSQLKQSSPKEAVVVIDPGHGGEELGTCHEGMYEKAVNLDISLRMNSILKGKGVKTVMTREKDVYLGLKERANLANSLDAVLFISVHNNYMPGQPGYKGTETLYCPPQKPAFKAMDGTKLAQIVQKELVSTLKTVDNGIIYRPNLAVIRRTNMPAVIAEIAYISNASDRNKLGTSSFRQKAAQALANAAMKALDDMGAYLDTTTNKLMVNPN